MSALTVFLQIALPFLYAILVWIFGEIFFRPGETSVRVKRLIPLVIITLILHGAYIGLYTVETGHCLLTTLFELLSLLAFTLLGIYAIVEIRVSKEASGTGFFIAVVSFLFQVVSSLFIEPEKVVTNPVFKSAVFNTHVTTAVFGYAALTVSCIYGSLYLLLYRAMRTNKFGPVFEHLPNLERLERYGFRTTGIGFIFLSISIALGMLLMKESGAQTDTLHYLLDPKILFTVLVWLVFGTTLIVRKFARMEGRKLVLLWMWGFALTIISMTVVNLFGTTFHSFL